MVIFSRSMSRSLQQRTEEVRFESTGVWTKLAHGYSRCSERALRLGGKYAQPVNKDKNFPVLCLLHIINNIATFRAVALNTLSLSLTDSQTSGQNLRKWDTQIHVLILKYKYKIHYKYLKNKYLVWKYKYLVCTDVKRGHPAGDETRRLHHPRAGVKNVNEHQQNYCKLV